jgi:hypothetical protein
MLSLSIKDFHTVHSFDLQRGAIDQEQFQVLLDASTRRAVHRPEPKASVLLLV